MTQPQRPTPDPTLSRPAIARRTGLSYRDALWPALLIVMIGGWFYPLLGLAVPLCFLGALVVAPFAGRKWCGKACPRGMFFDRVLARFSPSRPIPAWARHTATRIAVLVVLMSLLTLRLTTVWGDWAAVGGVFVIMLTVTTIFGVAVGLFTHQRVWCTVCPAGTLAGWIGARRGPRPALDTSKCTDCSACARRCPMNLQPTAIARSVGRTHLDCTSCGTCAATCRLGALELTAVTTPTATPPAAEEEPVA